MQIPWLFPDFSQYSFIFLTFNKFPDFSLTFAKSGISLTFPWPLDTLQEHNSLIWNSKLLSHDGLPSPHAAITITTFLFKKITTKNKENNFLTAYKISMYQTPATRITVLVAIRQCMILDDHKESTNIFFVQHSTPQWLYFELSKVCYTMIIFFTNSTHWLIFTTKRTGLKIHNHIFTLKWSHCNQSLFFPFFNIDDIFRITEL